MEDTGVFSSQRIRSFNSYQSLLSDDCEGVIKIPDYAHAQSFTNLKRETATQMRPVFFYFAAVNLPSRPSVFQLPGERDN